MKQLLFSLFSLLPCLALAQYPSNANQKITLGEQTTADGLIYRGLAADTTRKPSVDTMAYMLLDTATNIMWHYKKATSNAWLRVGGSISSGLTGTLPVANGGTGRTTMPDGYILHGDGNAVDTSIGLFWDRTNNRLGIETISPAHQIDVVKTGNINVTMRVKNDSAFNLFQIIAGYPRWVTNDTRVNGKRFDVSNGEISKGVFSIVNITNGNYALVIDGNNNNNLGIGITTPAEKLHVVGNGRITGAYSSTTASAANLFVDSDGDLLRSTSSIKYKSDVEDYAKGLNEVMKLRPVTYKSINSNNDKIYAGFIAEELADLKLTELYENNDNGEPDAISYAYMVTLLTKAIQQQQSQIENLKKRIINLENK
jgi:hypothetical protein